jgi:hypothetical protein
LKLHRGLIGILPGTLISLLQGLRSRYYKTKLMFLESGTKIQTRDREEERSESETRAG